MNSKDIQTRGELLELEGGGKSSKAPATKAPATKAPATKAPATKAPATKAPATKAPATKAPATRSKAPAIPVVAAAEPPRKIDSDPITDTERLTDEFITKLYETMWQFINHDTIAFILKSYGCNMRVMAWTGSTTRSKVFPKLYRNTVCHERYGAEEDAAGHYYYIDKTGKAYGTYEQKLILNMDDGICHGAAILYAMTACGKDDPKLYPNPKTNVQLNHNYYSILSLYIEMIESGVWDKAIAKYFGRDVRWIKGAGTTHETQSALTTLKNYIKRFQE